MKTIEYKDTFIISIINDIFFPTSKYLYTIYDGLYTKSGLS